ncbi:hypothetical protein ABZX75_23865 [Streptomyces sp. NPDC003038]|uniref:hypothetical protein n=1 Tax=unclassified Streptomyces TaxID=2593676 RepID=UPI00339E0650
MIGEPELDGAWESARPAEVARPPADGGPGPGRPWWWVLAAVVATSAVWAGGLYAYGDRLTAPDIRYRASDDLCGQLKAQALNQALGNLADSADPRLDGRHPAVDWAMCSRSSDTPVGEDSYFIQAEYELHKKADPAVEFEVGTKHDRMAAEDSEGEIPWEPVPGLGEQALLTTSSTDGDLHLRVRDGGAVFILRLVFLDIRGRDDQGGVSDVQPARPRPDRETLKTAMIEDMRSLMAALKKP